MVFSPDETPALNQPGGKGCFSLFQALIERLQTKINKASEFGRARYQQDEVSVVELARKGVRMQKRYTKKQV